MNLTQTQNKQLHALLTQTGMMGSKAMLVHAASNGRTESSRDLSIDEAKYLITYLNRLPNSEQQKAEKMRRKILSMAHEMGWHHIQPDGHFVIDMEHVNEWMKKYSYGHKPLNAYTSKELPKLVTQFEGVYKSFLNKI